MPTEISERMGEMRYALSVTPSPEQVNKRLAGPPFGWGPSPSFAWSDDPTLYRTGRFGVTSAGARVEEDEQAIEPAVDTPPIGTNSDWTSIIYSIGKKTGDQLIEEAVSGGLGGNLLGFLTNRRVSPRPAAFWALGLGMKRAGYERVAIGSEGYNSVMAFAASYFRLLRADVTADLLTSDPDGRLRRISALGTADKKGTYNLELVNNHVMANSAWIKYGASHALVSALISTVKADKEVETPKAGFDFGKLVLPLIAVGGLIFMAKKGG